jgi:hypothetical protein
VTEQPNPATPDSITDRGCLGTTSTGHQTRPWRALAHALGRATVGVLLASIALHWAAQHWLTTIPRGSAVRWVDSLSLAGAMLALAWVAGVGWQLAATRTTRPHEPSSPR